MAKLYRLWTRNMDGTCTCVGDWKTRAQCRKQAIGRWGHVPPFAMISTCATESRVRQVYGVEA